MSLTAERRPRRRRSRGSFWAPAVRPEVVLAAILTVVPLATARSQDPAPEITIRSVTFFIDGAPAAEPEPLLAHIVTRANLPGSEALIALQWMPFVPEFRPQVLDSLELRGDQERLRQFFVRSGFPDALVTYEVLANDPAADAVDIVFRVRRGLPIRVGAIAVVWVDTVSGLDPAEALAAIGPGLSLREGAPLDSGAVDLAALALRRWLGKRGRPFATVQPQITHDAAGRAARVLLRATIGPRARLGTISARGNRYLSTAFVVRTSGLRTGDWFSLPAVEAGAERLIRLAAVVQATVEVVPDQPVDSSVDVVLQVEEAPPRSIAAEAGYTTNGGLGGNAEWVNRGIFSNGQALAVTLGGQTGVLGLEKNLDQFMRLDLTFRQPIHIAKPLTLRTGPFLEYRDDSRSRSLAFGFASTLIHRMAALSSIALRYEVATRHIYQYRFGGASGIDFFELLRRGADRVLDEFGDRLNTSELTLSASLGGLDAPTDPRRGILVQPSVTLAFPGALSSSEYLTGHLRAIGYFPITQGVTLGLRFGAAKLIPFGKSIPTSLEDRLVVVFRLRDQLLTAGGSNDVRGWSHEMLGPKFPQVFLTTENGAIAYHAERFVPLGGANRLFGTAELRYPLPFLSAAWSSHVFADVGRIWTTDTRFVEPGDPLGVEGFFWSIGAGIDYTTFLGTLRMSVAYKMNPSILDLADPQDVTDAILADEPIDGVPRHNGRRFHLHLGIGTRL